MQNFPNVALSSQRTQLHLDWTTLVHLHLTLLRFFPICNNIFPFIVQCRFFYFWNRPWHSLEFTRILNHIPHLSNLFLLRFWFLSYPQTKIFSLEVYWKCFLHPLPWKNHKNTLKTQVSTETSSISRLFSSLDKHYSNILNTDVQKQIET